MNRTESIQSAQNEIGIRSAQAMVIQSLARRNYRSALSGSRAAARLSDSAADDEQAGSLATKPTMARLSRFTVAQHLSGCREGSRLGNIPTRVL